VDRLEYELLILKVAAQALDIEDVDFGTVDRDELFAAEAGERAPVLRSWFRIAISRRASYPRASR
jgi:hypothetical protein